MSSNSVKQAISQRLDEHVATQEAVSRSRAARYIKAGLVRVNGAPITKCGIFVSNDAVVEVLDVPRYVSRGGEKLFAALQSFDVDVRGKTVLDMGISTGGFTDCVLQAGAKEVIGIDVGHGQLAESLRRDLRVHLFEGVNARYAREQLPLLQSRRFQLIVVDLSFISLQLIFPEIQALLAEDGRCIALVKPQFEVGKQLVGGGGIVRNASAHHDVLVRLTQELPRFSLELCEIIESPILGTHGNREFLMCCKGQK